MSRGIDNLAAPFRGEEGISPILLGLFMLLNGLVLTNACLHDPTIGYDSFEHLQYIKALGRLHLPSSVETSEFFSPPLPYVFPALLGWLGLAGSWWAAKSAQVLNVVCSVGLTFYLLKICDFVRPQSSHLKVTSLFLLALLPVYYKTFAFVRGEPFVVFFAALVVYQALLLFAKENSQGNVIVLGLILGLLMLSRQWGFLVFPALILWVGMLARKEQQKRKRFCRALMAVLSISFIVGAWFYLVLWKNYGSVTAFNRSPQPRVSFLNQPGEFYFGLGTDKLFSEPLRPSLPNQFIPVFYSEIWGDYWEYFVVYGKDTGTGRFVNGWEMGGLVQRKPPPRWLETNRHEIAAYLGRVNLLALFPTMLGVAGFVCGGVHLWRLMRHRQNTADTVALSLCTLVVVFSLLGYLWFVIRYPNLGKGDNIKATYL